MAKFLVEKKRSSTLVTVEADKVSISEAGALVFHRNGRELTPQVHQTELVQVFAPGYWEECERVTDANS